MITTIETRLKLDITQESDIDSCVVLWSEFYRKVWKLWNNNHLSESDIYHQIMSFNILTSEQVGSLINKVKTEHSKIKELSKGNQQKILEFTQKIKVLESEGDKIYRKELACLFETCNDPIEIIKWKEILEHMEDALDHCESIGDLLRGVVMKYA